MTPWWVWVFFGIGVYTVVLVACLLVWVWWMGDRSPRRTPHR